MGAQRAGAPVLTGSVPPLAHFYHARQETGVDLADALRPGETVLLVPALLGTGGTGKTQLAIGFAHAMWSARAVDLLAWVPAGNRSAIIAGYAQAAADLGLLGDEERSARSADAAARRFLDWLRTTERRWAVVLDGVASPVDIDELWPRGPAGQVVVTSRLRESELAWSGAGVSAHAVAGFSRREALAYLNTRLTGFPDQRIEALDLAEDLGGLPIALAQAAAVVTVAGSTCRDYRAAYAERLRTTTETLVEGCPQSLLATWSLAVEHAHELPPGGLSWPALVFASALDTSGIPAAVLTSPAACGYITGRTGTGGTARAPLATARRAPTGTWCGQPTPPWSGSAWSASTPPARRAPSGCTRRCGPRCAPTWRRATSSRWRPPRPRRCSRPGRSLPPRGAGRSSARRCATPPPPCAPSRATCCGSRRRTRCCCGRERR